jgi:hypothetical protein
MEKIKSLRRKASVDNSVDEILNVTETSNPMMGMLHKSLSIISSPSMSYENSPNVNAGQTSDSPMMKGLFSEKMSRSSSMLMQAIEKAVINKCRESVPEEYKHLFNKDKKAMRRKKRKL